MDKDQYILSSVDKALDILDLLSEHDELSVSEISRKLKMGKASAFRILYTLERRQFIYKNSDAKYGLGIKLAHYGMKVLERRFDIAHVRPFLHELKNKHNETVHLGILDADCNVIVIDKVESDRTIQMTSRFGGKLPGYCTAMGKVLLASLLEKGEEEKIRYIPLEKKTDSTITNMDNFIKELEKIKNRGYSEDLEESEEGLVCYAAPIKDITGNTVAAISMSGPSSRMLKNKDEIIKSVVEVAKKVSRRMGYIHH